MIQTILIIIFIGNLQDVLGGKRGLVMETTPHVTILNKRKHIQYVQKFKDAIKEANEGGDGFLGPLTLEKVIVGRGLSSITAQQQQYTTFCEMNL